MIIPQKQHVLDYPVINSPGAEINSMKICAGARVTIGVNGSLSILNPDFCDDVSRIVVNGTLHLPHSAARETREEILSFRNLN